MANTPRISVVLASYRQRKTIEKTIRALLGQDFDDYEIIVVDSSNDRTTEIIRLYAKETGILRLIELKRRTPAGIQRNIGIRHAKADIIAITDTDCIPRKDWLKKIHASISDETPGVGGACGNGNPESAVGWASYLLEFSHFLPNTAPREARFLPGANLAFKRDLPEKHGYFPDLFFGEDLALTSKWAKQVKLKFDPKIRVDHINRSALGELFRNQYNLGKGSAIVRSKMDVSNITLPGKIVYFPILWLYRYIAIWLRVSGWRLRGLAVYAMLTPLILLSLVVWNVGFLRGYSSKDARIPDYFRM